jgi:hypothetical protein
MNDHMRAPGSGQLNSSEDVEGTSQPANFGLYHRGNFIGGSLFALILLLFSWFLSYHRLAPAGDASRFRAVRVVAGPPQSR